MKQTSIYLSERDNERLKKIKENRDLMKTNDAIREIIQEEYERIRKYNKETL